MTDCLPPCSPNVPLTVPDLAPCFNPCGVLGESCELPLNVQICPNDCAEPLRVEVCNPSIVEASLAPLGCIYDDTGDIVGKVFVCKLVNPQNGDITFVVQAFYENGDIVSPYLGEWGECVVPACVSDPALGIITDLSVLAA